MTINLLIYYLTFGCSELDQSNSSGRHCLEELDELPLIRFLLSSIRFSWRESSESQASERIEIVQLFNRRVAAKLALSWLLLLRDLVSHQRLNIHQGFIRLRSVAPLNCVSCKISIVLLKVSAHCSRSSIDVSVVILFWHLYLYNLAIGLALAPWADLFYLFDLKSNVHQWIINYIS